MNNIQKSMMFILVMLIMGCPFRLKQSKELNTTSQDDVVKIVRDEKRIAQFVFKRTEDMFHFFKEHPNKLTKQEINGLVDEIKSFKDEYKYQIQYMLEDPDMKGPIFTLSAIYWYPDLNFRIILDKIHIDPRIALKDLDENSSDISKSKYKWAFDAMFKAASFNDLAFQYHVLNYPIVKNSASEIKKVKAHINKAVQERIKAAEKFNIDKSLFLGNESLYERLFQ
jgi:hypothetical protein